MADSDDPIPPIPVPPVEAAPIAYTAPTQPAAPQPSAAQPPAPTPYPQQAAPTPYPTSAPLSVPRPDPYAPPAPAYAAPSGYTTQGGPAIGLSVAAMITGIVGVFFALFGGLGLFPSVAAVIMGHIAQKKQKWARGYWITALITGYIGLAISLFVIGIFALAVIVGMTTEYN